MTNKNTFFIIVLVVIVLAGIAFVFLDTPENKEQASTEEEKTISNGETSKPPSSSPSTPSSTTPPPSASTNSETGRLLFAITDDTLPINDVSSVFFTMSSLTARNSKGKWITISNTKHTYDLLQLKRDGKQELVLDTTIPIGTYDQLSFVVDSVVMVKNGIAQTAKLPASTIYVPLSLPLRSNQTAAILLDIVADKSLHVINTGQLVFAPVFEINTLGEIQTVQKSGSKVEFFSGLPKFAGSYGMDETGTIRKDSLGIDSLSHIELVGDIFVLIPQSLDRSLFTISPSEAIHTAVNGNYISQVAAIYAELFEKKPVWRVQGIIGNGTAVSVYVNAKTGSIEKVQ